MTTAEIAAVPLSDLDHRAQLRRAVIASTVGTTIEWYDFLLYGQMAALVFAKLYFPSSDPLIGTLQAFAVFAVGFVARPIGAAIFGHYGDRIGRKAALIATLLLTGLSTFLVGCVPTYEQIGVWGAVVMVILRFIQGIGVGGEWGGSVLLAMEWARTSKHRGLYRVLAAIRRAGRLVPREPRGPGVQRMSGDQFLTWGWRIPFLLSIVMVGDRAVHPARHPRDAGVPQAGGRRRIERAPVLEVIRRQPKEIILTALARMAEQAPFYHLHRLRFHLWHAGAACLARLPADRAADRRRSCRSSRSRFPATYRTGSAASACI